MAVTRQNFENALKDLQCDILRLGSMVEQAIDRAIQSLAKQDAELAQQVINGDNEIDHMDMEIEDKCIKLIATQQPIAKDLRKIGAGFKIITDLERMADYAVDIAKVTIRIHDEPLIKPLIDIPRMATLTQKMVHECLDAYVSENVDLARKVGNDDHEVDHLYATVFDDLMEIMTKKPTTVKQGTYLLLVARALERIADHATNVGEDVIFLVTGERKEIND